MRQRATCTGSPRSVAWLLWPPNPPDHLVVYGVYGLYPDGDVWSGRAGPESRDKERGSRSCVTCGWGVHGDVATAPAHLTGSQCHQPLSRRYYGRNHSCEPCLSRVRLSVYISSGCMCVCRVRLLMLQCYERRPFTSKIACHCMSVCRSGIPIARCGRCGSAGRRSRQWL